MRLLLIVAAMALAAGACGQRGPLYLRDNPLLKEPLKAEHIKQRLLGHWGSSPGLSFIYVHLNRLINKYDLNAMFIAGAVPEAWRDHPDHGTEVVTLPPRA